MRIVHLLAYVGFIFIEVIKGSFAVAQRAIRPGSGPAPSIIEFVTRCRTDLEIAALASSITITPGTLVVGIAAADDPLAPSLFVHTIFAKDRDDAVASLRDVEARLLRATRKAEDR